MHRNTIPFCLEKVSSQKNARSDPHATMQRVPSLRPFQWKVQLVPRISVRERFAHRLTIKAELGNCEHAVCIYPSVWTTDRTLNLRTPRICKMRNLVYTKVGVARNVAQSQAGQQVKETN